MNKTKCFVFVAVIIVITLFVFGSWGTSAHATGLIDNATPTPTNMPVNHSDTQLGEIPSEKEQELLKAIVHEYVDIRYRALSLSGSGDITQNGFDDLVSDGSESHDFQRKELGKLSVEIKYAQLNQMRYADYEFILNFRDITIDPSTQDATIVVSEENKVVYEISAELNPINPIISQSASIKHIIVLRKNQGQWQIISDVYNDDLWKMLRQSGQTTDEILHTTDEIVRTMNATPRQKTFSTNKAETASYSVPDDPSSHPYYRIGAVEYALEHWSDADNLYNPDYVKFPLTDCQNFVSQALYEGGKVTMFIPYPDNLTPGGPGWYYLDYLNESTNKVGGGWADVGLFYTRVTDLGEAWSEVFNGGPVGVDITLPQNDQVPAGLELGDVIQYDWGKNGTWDHAAIVVDFEGGIPYVAAHTTDRYKVPYTLQANTNYRFIHIIRSNGYYPVKAQVQAGADDAGIGQGCNFSSTGLEIYLGHCLNGTSIVGGFRFNGVEIPPGAQLKYAYLTFTTDGLYANTVKLQIDAETGAQAAAFTSNFSNPVEWDILETEKWELGDEWGTPALTQIVQDVIDGSWNYDDPLAIIFGGRGAGTAHRRVISYERANTNPTYIAAKLIAAYDLPGLTAPVVYSITRAPGAANPTNAASVNFIVTFSEPVTGVDTGDFAPANPGGGLSGLSVSGVTGSGAVYTVSVNTGAGSGQLRLDVKNENDIISAADNEPLNSGFRSGETYTIDKISPSIQSIIRASPNPTNADTVDFSVIFSEDVVLGIASNNFVLAASGISNAGVQGILCLGNECTVTASTGMGSGTLRLDIPSTANITDLVGNTLSGLPYTSGEVYTVRSVFISGSTHVGGTTLNYVVAGVQKSVTADSGGNYTLTVPLGWSGTVTPSGYAFQPASRTYANVQTSLTDQDYWRTFPASWGGDVRITSSRPVIAVGRLRLDQEVMTYNGFGVGGTKMYVPMLFKNAYSGNYNAALNIQNTDLLGSAAVNVEYYDSTGSLTCQENFTIARLGVRSLWLPNVTCLPNNDNGWVGGAVITADRPVAAVGRPHIGSQVTTYAGFSSGSKSMYLPMLFKGAFDRTYNAAFYVQNTAAYQAADITIRYYDSNGVLTCTETDTLAPLASKGYWLPSVGCLPAGWVGGAVVTATQDVVAIGRPHIGEQVTTYNAFSGGAASQRAPKLFKKAFGGTYNAALYIQNTSASQAAIQINCFDANGNLTCTVPDTLAPLASKGYWLPSIDCLSDGWVGGAVVTANTNIAVLGRPHVGAEVMTYSGVSGGSNSFYLPMLYRNFSGSGGTYNSAIYLQNTDTVHESSVDFLFLDESGSVHCAKTVSLPAGATLGYWLPSLTCTP